MNMASNKAKNKRLGNSRDNLNAQTCKSNLLLYWESICSMRLGVLNSKALALYINAPCHTSRWNMTGRSISNAREMLRIMPVLVHIMWFFIFPLKLLLQKQFKSWKLHGKEQNRINKESIWGATAGVSQTSYSKTVAAVTWLEYCIYGLKLKTTNQSINLRVLTLPPYRLNRTLSYHDLQRITVQKIVFTEWSNSFNTFNYPYLPDQLRIFWL